MGSYEIECLVLGILVTDECKSEDEEVLVKNVTAGVEMTGADSPLENCSIGGTGSGTVEFKPENVWLETESSLVLDTSSE